MSSYQVKKTTDVDFNEEILLSLAKHRRDFVFSYTQLNKIKEMAIKAGISFVYDIVLDKTGTVDYIELIPVSFYDDSNRQMSRKEAHKNNYEYSELSTQVNTLKWFGIDIPKEKRQSNHEWNNHGLVGLVKF